MRIEVICTANICRSPFVAQVLGHELEQVSPGDYAVTGSGTLALTGSAPSPEVRELARQRGLSLRGLRATQTTPALLSRADLILVMAQEHRELVIDEYPGAARRTFLLKELARLLEDLDAEQPWTTRLAGLSDQSARGRWTQAVRTLARARDQRRGDDDELADPYRKGQAAFDLMAVEAVAAIERIVAFAARTGPRTQP